MTKYIFEKGYVENAIRQVFLYGLNSEPTALTRAYIDEILDDLIRDQEPVEEGKPENVQTEWILGEFKPVDNRTEQSTLRDQLAMAALPALIELNLWDYAETIRKAYEYADEMLKQRDIDKPT